MRFLSGLMLLTASFIGAVVGGAQVLGQGYRAVAPPPRSSRLTEVGARLPDAETLAEATPASPPASGSAKSLGTAGWLTLGSSLCAAIGAMVLLLGRGHRFPLYGAGLALGLLLAALALGGTTTLGRIEAGLTAAGALLLGVRARR